MAIAVDQSKLRAIMETMLAGEHLSRDEAMAVLQIAQLAAGVSDGERAAERAVLQGVAQRVYSLVGLEPAELRPLPEARDRDAQISWFRALSATLRSRAARELGFAVAFLVAISDLELRRSEHETLEELQRALGVDHRRATDIVVQLTEIIASSRRAA